MTTWASLTAHPDALRTEYRRYSENTYPYSLKGWLDTKKALVADPENVKAFECGQCGNLHFEEGEPVRYGAGPTHLYTMCGDCIAAYRVQCALCEEQYHSNYTHLLPDGRRACQTCYTTQFSTCRTCGVVYNIAEDREVHRHRDQMCCESPAQDFTFPYEGTTIGPDERVEVNLGSGGTVTKAMGLEIGNLIMRQGTALGDAQERGSRAYKMYQVGYCIRMRYDTTVGQKIGKEMKNKDGNFTTRLKRYAYKEWALKMEPSILTAVGNIVSQASNNGVFRVEVTRDLNLSAPEFGNPNSCWWSNYKESRCALKTNGGLGLRAFDEHGNVIGRTWVMPLKMAPDGGLTTTFDTTTGLFFVFNGYGVLEDQTGWRVVQAMVEADEKKLIGFEANRYYVNSSKGYLLGPTAVLDKIGHLNLPLQQHSDLYEQENPTEKAEKVVKVKAEKPTITVRRPVMLQADRPIAWGPAVIRNDRPF